ncbi:MAG: Rpn family recombination-promoting nuclease/putative transposase [Calothrix sp. C42_A2020_038]|nr:Rpn family recombination-promoting nuclease/putative transposase [Calothrix sp. C42_A2020_038]
MSFDNVCKILAEKHPVEFARWLLNVEPSNVKVLKTELSIEPIRADSVTFLQLPNRILHIEFQTLTLSNPPIPLRMASYSIRLKTIYRCPVTQVVIFLQQTDDEIAFQEEYVDETTIHHYRSVRMWEQDPGLFLNNSALLPLAPLTQTDSPQALMSQVAEEIAKIPNRVTRQDIAGYTEILAGLRFKKDFIRQLLSEDIMQESVIYQDIVQKEAFKFFHRQLLRRFNEVDSSIIERIRQLPADKIETLGEEFLDFSDISDLVAWLDQQAR